MNRFPPLALDSPLRHLAANIHPRQALFFDGLRHSIEIGALAYTRLRSTLTHIALNDLNEADIAVNSTAAFLDAWAFVDAIDRFRMLWNQMPRTEPTEPFSSVSLDELAKPLRDLRNVADHIAQRIDLVMAQKGSAIGVLSWYTVTEVNPVRGYLCAIIPGTLIDHSAEIPTPSGHAVELPTGPIWLEAGGYRACLCDIIPHVMHRIRDLESTIAEQLPEMSPDGSHAPSDVVFKAIVRFDEATVAQVPTNR